MNLLSRKFATIDEAVGQIFRRFLWLLLSPLILATTSFASAAGESSVAPNDPVLGSKSRISVWSYSKSFAKRFNLPEMVEEGLPPDIWALEFRLVWRDLENEASFYDCELHAYVNNKLKILFPEGEVGSIETLAMARPAQPAKMPSLDDRAFHGGQSSSYRLKAVFSSKSKKSSLGGTVPYLRYRKYFLSDVAYLVFSLSGCSALGDPKEYESELWIEKEGGRDYHQSTRLDGNDFYQFRIPQAFVQRFYPHAKMANDRNSARIAAENRSRREKLRQQNK